MTEPLVGLDDVRAAAERFEGRISRTPFLHSLTLSEVAGAEVWLKFENLQFTGSFKQRGALNALLSLDAKRRKAGVATVSAGNHAQGLAYHAAQLGIAATIIMPQGTPGVKVQRTRQLGAHVELCGTDFGEATQHFERLVKQTGMVPIHPFDDDRVIAGQGTVALEIFEEAPQLDTILVSIGGGGLISGVAAVAREMAPDTKIIGVQSAVYPSMAAALGFWQGSIKGGSTIAEGIAVKAPGARTREHVKRWVDEIIVVEEEVIETSIALLLQIEKTMVEGAGAAGLAALLANRSRFAGQRVGLILSGGNIDNRVLQSVLQRQEARDGKLARLTVHLSDRRGELGALCTCLGDMGANINYVRHSRGLAAHDAKSALIEVELDLPDPSIKPFILEELEKMKFRVVSFL